MDFHKTVDTFESTDGKHSLRGYLYEPLATPRAVLQITHGMCEYLERYERFAGFLCGRGFAVCGNDHLGHGRLAYQSGELGYFGEKDGWRHLPEDAHRLTIRMKERYPGLPYFLMGHSMGSFVARCYLETYGGELDGAIIMGTSGGNPFAGFGVGLAKGVIRKHGGMYRSPLLDRLSMGGNNKRFRAENDKDSWLSKDKSVRAAYRSDPLSDFVFTASGYRDLFSLLRHVSASEWAGRVPKDLPVLLASGADDPIGDYGKGVRKVYGRLKAAGVRDVTLRLYEGDRHEILNETDREQVCREIGGWLEERLDGRRGRRQ